ncbi:MAG TPA: lysine--tRNA ligase [Terriglobales bacterium]|nr:lysine--tRNA ligase [Terriglobales bacterium]
MSLDHEIMLQRQAKLAAMRAEGRPAYPQRFAFSHTLAQVRGLYDGAGPEPLEADKPAVAVCGRLMTLRTHGKAGFAHLQQDGERLQVYVRQDAVDADSYALWKSLDMGDFIGVHGYVFRTRTGELTIHAQKLTFLAKDLLPLPEKWHGLQDVEIRYRQRYLDLLVNPDVRKVFVQRARLIDVLRQQFHARGYIEVETPMMQPLAGGATARPFTTHHEALDLPLYLRIAPELYLKRLVVGGLDRVFEINRNFRNEGISTQHNPEFTMLEFYEAYSDYNVLMEWSQALLGNVAQEVAGTALVKFRGHEIDFLKFRRLSLRQAIHEFWPPDEGPAPSREAIHDPAQERALAERYNRFAARRDDYTTIALDDSAGEGALLTAVFEQVAERHLVQPTIIFDFPVAVSPLAKNKPEEPAWVERFEIYAGGMEIANGYSELNDPEEQRLRFEQQLAQREGGNQEAHALDEDYIRALRYGLPPTAGEGIGIDRLCMLLSGVDSIRDVILFPLLRPEAEAAEA